MTNEDYYPAGACNDPNAPYNQSDVEPIDVEVYVSYSISKSTTVSITDYVAEPWEDYELGDEGETIHTGGIDYEVSNSSLKEAYLEDITLEDIIRQCYDYAKEELETIGEKTSKGLYLKRLMKACECWNVDELEVVKD